MRPPKGFYSRNLQIKFTLWDGLSLVICTFLLAASIVLFLNSPVPVAQVVSFLIPANPHNLQLSADFLRAGAAMVSVELATICFIIGIIIYQPLRVMTGAAHSLTSGYLTPDNIQAVQEAIPIRSDEVHLPGNDLLETGSNRLQMATIAQNVANGSLSVQIYPKSSLDELDHALQQMVTSLENIINDLVYSLMSLQHSSSQMTTAASQLGDATNQISRTTQKIARGVVLQTKSVNKPAGSAEQMARTLGGVAQGPQEQADAVTRASAMTYQITTIIQQISNNASNVLKFSNDAADEAASQLVSRVETVSAVPLSSNKIVPPPKKCLPVQGRSARQLRAEDLRNLVARFKKTAH